MIIARLYGGLGNQMFQYASAKAIAHDTGHQVKFDLSWFHQSDEERRSSNRPYQLEEFEIDVPEASHIEVERTLGPDFLSVPALTPRKIAVALSRAGPTVAEPVNKLLYRTLGYCREIIHDKGGEIDFPYGRRYCDEMLSVPDDVYLEGYWQSYKYFESIREQLLSEFTLPDRFGPETVYSRIQSADNAVGVHVRRGDFVSKGYDLPQRYYHSAVSTIESLVDNPKCFVFSDDTAWVKDHLDLGRGETHAEGNPAHVDMRLLTACNHQITANSTFSWWASWLNKDEDKRVLTPHSDDEPQFDDYIPSSWISVDY